jgi:hypothetical protein
MIPSVSTSFWWQISDGYSATSVYCYAFYSSGAWNAVMTNMIVGSTAAFVVVY